MGGLKMNFSDTDIKLETTDRRHGGPYDRGSADSYYRRPPSPHYYEGRTYLSRRIPQEEMTKEQIREYHEGYKDNEEFGDYKDYGFEGAYRRPFKSRDYEGYKDPDDWE